MARDRNDGGYKASHVLVIFLLLFDFSSYSIACAGMNT